MKIVACIPFWFEFDKINSMYMKKLAGEYLINYTVDTLTKVDLVDEIIVFCSNEKILDYTINSCKLSFLKRDSQLDSDNICIEEIIASFLQSKDADIIVLIHPNCPFIKKTTIQECIESIINDDYDSSFTALKLQRFAWMNDKRLNYSEFESTPDKKLISPIILEHGSVYVFHKNTFEKLNRRIGKKPFIKYINHFEGHEVTEKEDYETAELIINSGMNME